MAADIGDGWVLSMDPPLPPTLAPFVEAVARHVTFGLGADPHDHGASARESDAARRALDVLRDAGALAAVSPTSSPEDTLARDAAARRLLAEPAMLAAFFQNLDLLYAHRAPGADAVSLLLMRAMEL